MDATRPAIESGRPGHGRSALQRVGWDRVKRAVGSGGLRRAVAALSLLSFASAFGAALVLVTQSLLARHMGPSSYGLFASSLATVSMIAPFAGFGLSQFRLRVYGVEGWAADRWIRPSLQFSLVTLAIAFATVGVWAFAIAPTAATQLLLLLMAPVILGAMGVDVVSSKLRLEERYRLLALWQLMTPAGRMLVAITAVLLASAPASAVALGYGLVGVAVAAFAAPHVLAMLRGDMVLHGHGPRPASSAAAQESAPGAWDVWRHAWPYGAAAALYPVFFQVSTVLLKYLGSDAQAGLFGISMAVMTAIYLIPSTVYHKFLLSKLHRWAAHDRPRFWMVYRRGVALMFLFGLAIGALMWALAPVVVPLIFGESYSGVVRILLVLALCPPIRFLTTAVGSVLLSSTHMYYRVLMLALAAGMTIAMDVALIPRWGELGAAWAIVCGEVALLVMTWIGARRFGPEFH